MNDNVALLGKLLYSSWDYCGWQPLVSTVLEDTKDLMLINASGRSVEIQSTTLSLTSSILSAGSMTRIA